MGFLYIVTSHYLSYSRGGSSECHLFWIDADYRVRLAENFGEPSGGDFGVRRIEGQALRLLQRPAWWLRTSQR